MHAPEMLLAPILMASLTFYVLLGGADYGGGVWDLLASGPRRQEQRDLISHAITPVWEANHVWLILVVVLLFAGFPAAFAAMTTALNIPLTVLIVGIVMRGSSFVFRAYHTGDYRTQRRWGLIFAIASTVTPICLGVVVGAISSGHVSVRDGVSVNGFLAPWLGTFPLIVGLFALSLFVFLAAVYLAVEAREPALQEDFRRKALVSGAIVAVMALGTFLAARTGAPDIYSGLLRPSLVWIAGSYSVLCHRCFYRFVDQKVQGSPDRGDSPGWPDSVGLGALAVSISPAGRNDCLGGGAASSMGTDCCISRWTSCVVSVDLVSDATL